MEHTPEEEERINAVLRYLEGERQVDIYRSLERSKFWFNKWMGRYKTGRKDWYKDLPKSATVIPHKTSEQIEQVVVNLRKALTDGTEDATKYSCVGAEAIQFHMEGLGHKPVDIPSLSTIKRIIKRNKMTVKSFSRFVRFTLYAGVEVVFIAPSKPWMNGMIEEFNKGFDVRFWWYIHYKKTTPARYQLLPPPNYRSN